MCIGAYQIGFQRGLSQREQLASVPESQLALQEVLMPKTLSFYDNLNAKNIPTVSESEAQEPTKQKEQEGSSIQMSAFKEMGKAEELMDQLKNKGFRVFLISDEGPNPWHRVFVGPFSSKEEALDKMENLKSKGFSSGFVVSKKKQ